ncbi:MAG TPA: hypothetical protein VH855_10395 [Acetobacteraceae bacterium]|jgi:hypothetical protein
MTVQADRNSDCMRKPHPDESNEPIPALAWEAGALAILQYRLFLSDRRRSPKYKPNFAGFWAQVVDMACGASGFAVYAVSEW